MLFRSGILAESSPSSRQEAVLLPRKPVHRRSQVALAAQVHRWHLQKRLRPWLPTRLWQLRPQNDCGRHSRRPCHLPDQLYQCSYQVWRHELYRYQLERDRKLVPHQQRRRLDQRCAFLPSLPRSPADVHSGHSWCGFPYNDQVPGFAPSVGTMLRNFGGSYERAATAYCGLEARFTTPDGKTATLFITDGFDDTWVRTPASVDVVIGSVSRFCK